VKRATNRHDVQFDCAQAAGAAPEHTEPRLPIDGFVSLPIEPRYARSHAHFPNPGDPCASLLEATDMPALFVQVNIEARTVAASSGIQALWRSTRPAVGAPWAAQPPQGEPRVKTWRRRIILMVQAGAGAVAVTVTVKGTPVCAPPAAQPQPSRSLPAPHSDSTCAIGRAAATLGLHDTALGLRAQLEPLVPDPPGICGEEQIIPARRAAARRRFFDRCAPPAAHAAHATSPLYFTQLSPCREAGPAHPTCTLSHDPLISLLIPSILLTHPLPSLASSSQALGRRWCAGCALRIAALAIPWELSHACGRSGHVLCEEHAHALCFAVWHARGAE
jgi:hypothetical protein